MLCWDDSTDVINLGNICEDATFLTQKIWVTHPKYKSYQNIPPYDYHHGVFHWKAYLRSYTWSKHFCRRSAANNGRWAFSEVNIAKTHKICRNSFLINTNAFSYVPYLTLCRIAVITYHRSYVGPVTATGGVLRSRVQTSFSTSPQGPWFRSFERAHWLTSLQSNSAHASAMQTGAFQ